MTVAREPSPGAAPPSPALFADVVGQADAVGHLLAAARRPVHAYLLVGPPGLGQQALVRGFAAALSVPPWGVWGVRGL